VAKLTGNHESQSRQMRQSDTWSDSCAGEKEKMDKSEERCRLPLGTNSWRATIETYERWGVILMEYVSQRTAGDETSFFNYSITRAQGRSRLGMITKPPRFPSIPN